MGIDVGSLSVNTAQMWTNANVKATLSITLRQSLSEEERAWLPEDWCKLEKHCFVCLVIFKKDRTTRVKRPWMLCPMAWRGKGFRRNQSGAYNWRDHIKGSIKMNCKIWQQRVTYFSIKNAQCFQKMSSTKQERISITVVIWWHEQCLLCVVELLLSKSCKFHNIAICQEEYELQRQ